MRAVIQRVTHGWVSVEGRVVDEIGLGLVILLEIGPDGNEGKVCVLSSEIAKLRVFDDGQGKMDLTVHAVC